VSDIVRLYQHEYTQIQQKGGSREYDLAVKTVQRQRRLEEDRKLIDSAWSDIDDYMLPRRAVYNLGQQRGRDRGDKVGEKIYDGTAGSSGLDLADAFQGHSASPGMKWWGLNFLSKEARHDVILKRWQDEAEETASYYMAESNLYNELNECFVDGVFYCTATMSVPIWLPGENKLSFQTMHPREIFIARDWQGKINLYHRKFPLSGRQIIQEFGKDKLPPTMVQSIDQNPFRTYQVIHAIYPREERDVAKLTPQNKKIASVWVLEEQKVVLRESGFDYWPMITWCWRLSSMETYGRGPGIDTIYDAVTGNSMMKTLLNTGQMLLQPPLIADQDLKTKIKLTPGGITWRESPNQKVERLYEPSPNYAVGVDAIQRMREELRDKFKAKTFTLLSQLTAMTQRMNLVQTAEIQGEKAALMIPMAGRNQSELLVPLVQSTWRVLARNGKLPPPPPSVMRYLKTNVAVRFFGPMAIAQKRFLELQGINPALDRLAEIGKEFPELKQAMDDHLDPDETFSKIWEAYGAPAQVQRDPATLQQVRMQRMKMIQAQQKIAMAERLAKGYKDVNAAPEEGSPAESLMGAFGG